MIPTRRLVGWAALPAVLAAAAIPVPGMVYPWIAANLVLALIAAADLALARGSVTVRREAGAVQAIGRPFPVSLSLRNTGRRRLRLRVHDDAPGDVQGLPAAVELEPDAAVTQRYDLRIGQRGAHRFGAVAVRWASPLGLWERQQRVPIETAIRVYPDFAQLRRSATLGRAGEAQQPVRARRRPGGENEFERLRPYVAGDPYRHIDWRATARRGEFVSREFQQEANQNLVLMLDAGRMMGMRFGAMTTEAGGMTSGSAGMTAFDHALNAALLMGQAALRRGDRVGLLAFDQEIRAWVPPKGGARAGARLIRGSYDVFPGLAEPDYPLAFRHLTHHVKRRSLVVLFTAVVDEVQLGLAETLVKGLVGRHLPLCVWLRDPEQEALLDAPATTAEARYHRAAAAELATWRERSLQTLRRRGALVVDCRPDELAPELLARYLEIKARRLL
jgi:uncharacterized protein (DUF58 family)